MSDLSEADTRAKLIDPAIHARGWTEDFIKREESAGAVEIIAGKPKVDKRTPAELLDVIEAKGKEIEAAVKALRSRGAIRAAGGKEAVKS